MKIHGQLLIKSSFLFLLTFWSFFSFRLFACKSGRGKQLQTAILLFFGLAFRVMLSLLLEGDKDIISGGTYIKRKYFDSVQ